MELIKNSLFLQKKALEARYAGKITALVPTMGSLHAGHLSLLEWARKNAELVFLSIFVNPAQFRPGEDLEAYPRGLEADLAKAGKVGADIVFAPEPEEMYPDQYATFVNVERVSNGLCGSSRPGHFRGVATVITKLFNLVLPNFAIFGEKDWQQLAVIKQMTKDLNFPVEIIGCPTFREPDGLAMSSRNIYLNEQERLEASRIYEGLLLAKKWSEEDALSPAALRKRILNWYEENIPTGKVDYIEIVDSCSLKPANQLTELKTTPLLVAVALKFSQARLIDNILLA